MGNMLVPLPFVGSVEDFKKTTEIHTGYEWITQLPEKNIHLHLFQRWPSNDNNNNLPLNHDIYIVSFHLEAVDVQWLKEQVKKITGEIIVLFDGVSNNYTIPKVRFLSYYYWHIQLETMLEWFGSNLHQTKQITHKASAFCNRITSTKLITFTALAEYVGIDNCILVLHDWLESDNIYNEDQYSPDSLMYLFDIFFTKYYGKTYKIDEFSNVLNNHRHTANPWTSPYQNCAIHFTNESFDTSALFSDALYAHPGPFITEKTLKCLLGRTAFVPIGQFNTYEALRRVGFEFNYPFDTTFDNISQDNDRLVANVNLIKTLSSMTPEEIYSGTKESSERNFNYINDGVFYRHCNELNEHTITQVLEHINLVTN